MKNKSSFRILSFILVAVLIATSVFVALPFALADATMPNAYYALKGYQNGVGPADANWQYNALVLKNNTPFKNSDDSFLAPTVQMSASDYEADFSWQAITDATSYEVNLYHVVGQDYELFRSANVSTPSYEADNLTKGDTLYVQIIALDENGQELCASHIVSFSVYIIDDVFVVLNDASDSSTYSSTFPNTAATTAVPDGKGISYQTSTQRVITFSFPETDLAQFEAIGYYIDNSANTTPYSYYGMQVNGTTITRVLKDVNQPGVTDVNAQGFTDSGEKFAINTGDWEDNCWDTNGGQKGWFTFDLNSSVIGTSYKASAISLKSHGWFNASTEANKNKTVLIDNLVAIKDLAAFASYLQSGDLTNMSTYKHVIYDDGEYECDTFDAGNNTLKNTIFNTGYTFNYNSTEGALRFNMVDTGANQIGASLKFVAPVDGLFDISSSFIIDGNNEPLTAYYRVVKTDVNGNESVVWPYSGEWHTFTADAANLNPHGDVRVAEAELKTGESARIEAYVKFADGSGSVNAILASPMVNVVDRIVDAKGTSTTYKLLDYDYNLNDAELTAGIMTVYQTETRFNFEAVDISAGNKVYPINRFVKNWAYFSASTVTGDNAGFYFNPNYLDFLVATPTRGVQIRITAPYESKMVYKSTFPNTDRVKYRVLINGSVVYPVSGDFDTVSGALNVACDVQKGDDVCIQLFETTGTGRVQGTLAQPTVTFTKGNTYNLTTNTKFNALLERPYDGENYVGEYVAPAASPFSFEIIDLSASEYLPSDTFDYSKGNFLYNSVSEETGFGFGQTSIIGKTALNKTIQLTEGYALATAFKAPAANIYDISAPVKVLEGEGTVAVRVTVNGEPVWPIDDKWFIVENAKAGDVINLPAQELQLTANQIVRIEVGAYETKSAMTFDLGQPMITINNNRIAGEKGYISIYAPSEYIPLYVADSYNGAIVDASTRFNFNFFKLDDQSVVAANVYDTTSQNKYYADGIPAAYYLSDGKIEFETDGTYGAQIDLVSPMDGSSVVGITTANGVEFAVLKNGEKIYPTDSDYALSDGNVVQLPSVETKIDDVITIRYKTASGKIDIGMPSVAITGVHKDDNKPTSTVFYPVSADPYKGDNYVGPYEQNYDIWTFETFNANTNDIGPVNYFDASGTDRYVYNTDMLNTGYYLKSPQLHSVINNGTDLYGTKVTLTIPYAENFEIQSDAIVITEDAEATVYFRITKNGEKLWPSDTDWATKTLATGESLDVPFIETMLEKGDAISFEMYADNIKVGGADADSIVLSYGVPKVNVCKAMIFEAPDATAKVYAFKDYNPYGTLGYNGTHILTGDNRWQVKGIDVNDGKFEITDMSLYMSSWAQNLLYSNDFFTGVFYTRPWLEGQLAAKRVQVQGENGEPTYKTETYGFSLVFNAPSDTPVKITGTPSLSGSSDAQMAVNAQIKFRILHNDTTIWPADGEWETLNVNSRSSKFPGADVDLKLGDTIQYQYYIDEINLTDEITNIQHTLELGVPSVVVVQPGDNDKKQFNAKTDFTTTYQISPYWKYQYALDKENPVWSDMEAYGYWNHWYSLSASKFLAINSGGAWIINKNAGDRSGDYFKNTGDANYGMVGYKFINPKDGWITISAGTVSTNTTKAHARIVCNGEVVWPLGGGWATLETKASYEKMVFQLKQGDWIRFEMTIDEETIVDWNLSRVTWQPALKYSDRDPAFSEEAGDIWSGVDLGLLDYFKTLNSELQFDIDYLTHKAEAEAGEELVSSNPKGHYEYVLKDNAGNNQQQQQQQQQQIIRRKKVVVVNGGIPLWLIVVIACVALVLIGGAVTLIILKKKGIIFTPALVSDEDNEENSSVVESDTDTNL